MKKHIHTIAIALILATVHTFAQGPLTPPGAPAPSMKTLAELSAQITALTALTAQLSAVKAETRTVITTSPFIISTPGSYVLGGNLAVTTGDAIVINLSEVTLDLNGFTISSSHPTGLGSGIQLGQNRANIRIKNGVIKGTTTYSGGTFTLGGFLYGIYYSPGISNVTASGLSVSGVAGTGIFLDNTLPGTIVERCAISTCGRDGIVAKIVRDSSVADCGQTAIHADFVSNCDGTTLSAYVGHFGIVATGVQNSKGTAVAGVGIFALQNAINSFGTSSSGIGMYTTNASNCSGSCGSGMGIYTTNASNCTGYSATGSSGIFATGTASYCQGQRDSGIAINAKIAIGCTVNGTGTVTAQQKFLGTP